MLMHVVTSLSQDLYQFIPWDKPLLPSLTQVPQGPELIFLVRIKEHSSNGKRGGGGFYLSAHISQSIHPRKINLVLNDRGQKSYLESTLLLAILSKKFS